MQVGTPSPYRAPSRPRIAPVTRNAALPDAANNANPPAMVRPVQVKAQANLPSAADLPVGLKTPSNHTTEWSKPKPPAANIPVPNFAAALESQPQVTSTTASTASTQKSSTKIVPSRYMQSSTQKVDPSAKTSKKNPSRPPLGTIDANNNSIHHDSDKRRLTMAATKKAPVTKPAANRTSMGPVSRPTSLNINAASATTNAVNATAPPSDSIFAATNARGAASTNSIPLSSSQADLRAALLARREQKASAAAAAAASKQTASKPGSARVSLGPNAPASRPSISSSRDLPLPSTKPTPGPSKAPLVRQRSNVESTLQRANSGSSDTHSQPSSGKVVPSRYMNFKSAAPEAEPLFEDAAESSAPTPTRTPGTLKRSFSTSSLKKLQTSKKATSQATTVAPAKEPATAAQFASLSARVAQATTSSSQNTVPEQIIPAASAPKPAAAPTVQSVYLEAQLLQTQLLQWHYINNRLEQAREAKRAMSQHMTMAVMSKIDEMRARTDELSAQLSVRQAKVYEAELEHFKLTCLAPIMYSVHSFLEKYSDTAAQLEKDTHKMPTHGVSVSDLYAILHTIEESHEILDRIQSEFSIEFSAWEETGQSVQRLASIVREESGELSAYSEMLHALSHLSTNEASLIFHKLQLEQAKVRVGGL